MGLTSNADKRLGSQIKGSKVAFFFGAGAEADKETFGLPSGADYTLETMLTKKEEMYCALQDFYKGKGTDYAGQYVKLFLFARNSHTFREMICDAAIQAETGEKENNCDIETKKFAKLVKKYRKIFEKDDKLKDEGDKELEKCLKDKITETSKGIYDIIVDKQKQKEQYKSLQEHIFYYGVVEKDFATILNPFKTGINRFWRLINYFWSAYFTIFMPLCEKEKPSWLPVSGGDTKKYKSILTDFPDRIIKVLNGYNYSKVDEGKGNYYSVFRRAFPCSYVLTTNYTPFVAHYFGKEKSTYLAGKLSEFEYPTELLVKDVIEDNCSTEKEEIKDDRFVFPFLMTQAPIKPIITPLQIKAYAQAIDKLKKASVLIIIGYSLGEADNHINAILRDYIVDEEKRLIYCEYSEDKKFDEESIRGEITKKLMLSKDMVGERIIVVKNNGNAAELLKKVQDIINEMS